MSADRSFYKVSFWLRGIITTRRAYCYYEAESIENALKQFRELHGQIKVIDLRVKKVNPNTQTYKILCSIYKEEKV